MKYIAILGFGVVGGGVAEVLEQTKQNIRAAAGDDVEVKYILDLREFPGTPWEKRVVHDISVITGDPEVELVVEAMGGCHPALEFSEASLRAKKHVVTSNKELVACFGDRLLSLAADNGVRYMFEASVGGGIPVIRTIRSGIRTDDIVEIRGILNGTTNYILTRMDRDGATFDEALAEAQRLGYAEANPAADVDGADAQRKICILAALATGKLVKVGDIRTESLRTVSRRDSEAAARFGGAIKLVARARVGVNGALLSVFPALLPWSDPLAHISDVYNGVVLKFARTGDVMLYGQGAGRYPTAGAMLGDIAAVLSGAEMAIAAELWQPAPDGYLRGADELVCRRYLRFDGQLVLPERLTDGATVLSDSSDGAYELITPPVSEPEYCALAAGLPVCSHIRVLD